MSRGHQKSGNTSGGRHISGALLAITVTLLGALSLSRSGYSQAVNGAATVDYNRDVHAILSDHCLVCHNAEKRSGGLSLGTYEDIMQGGKDGAAIKPGASGQSLLVRRIMGQV